MNVSVRRITDDARSDTARLDHLESLIVESKKEKWLGMTFPGGQTLRETLDEHMRPKPAPRYLIDMSVGEVASLPEEYSTLWNGLHCEASAVAACVRAAKAMVGAGVFPHLRFFCVYSKSPLPACDINDIIWAEKGGA